MCHGRSSLQVTPTLHNARTYQSSEADRCRHGHLSLHAPEQGSVMRQRLRKHVVNSARKSRLHNPGKAVICGPETGGHSPSIPLSKSDGPHTGRHTPSNPQAGHTIVNDNTGRPHTGSHVFSNDVENGEPFCKKTHMVTVSQGCQETEALELPAKNMPAAPAQTGLTI